MNAPDRAAIAALLADVPDPETGRGLGAMGQLVAIDADADAIAVTVGLTSHSAILRAPTRARIEERIRAAYPEAAAAERAMDEKRAPARQPVGV